MGREVVVVVVVVVFEGLQQEAHVRRRFGIVERERTVGL